ncbi:MAG: BamA/TamA family outer membrane protein [Acidobacteriia bacterium]|nr:BamA/TamA family outer membrane protein [Terriglobia bacterium]
MKSVRAGCFLLGVCLFAGTQDSEFNVNTRYTVEAVLVSGDGWTTNLAADHDSEERLSPSLRKQILGLIGDKLNPSELDDLASKLRRELRARTVTHRVLRGLKPQYVQVLFEVKMRPVRFDVSVPQLLYSSSQGFSGSAEAIATVAEHHVFSFGVLSDGDQLVERSSGITARYEDTHALSERVRLGFEFASYQELWNRSTRNAWTAAGNSASDLYRTRQVFQPEVTFVLARPLTLSLGASLEQLDEAAPGGQSESANALASTLRYRRRLDDSDFQQDFDADYSLRAASRLWASDFVYLRHSWAFRYTLLHGRHSVSDRASGGLLLGHAPLFERFVLGNSTSLRGWDRYEIDPLGGNRVVHNSVEYRYRLFESFYDSGAVWNAGEPVILRHSIGMGLHQGPLFVAVAFPVRKGAADPVFMVGMNY